MIQPFEEAFKSYPKLKKLQVDDGVFSLKSAALFRPVEKLIIRSLVDPDPTDMLCEE